MKHESDEERLENALRARASLAGDAAYGGDVTEGPTFGNAYRLGGLRNYGEDLADDDEALDEGVDEEE
jgi:hypothetical protein